MSEATFVDENGGKVDVSVWDTAIEMFDKVPKGAGVVVIGCSATKADSELKLSIWPSVHISTSGAQAEALTGLDATKLQTLTLTATFNPGQSVQASMEDVAFPTCAAALADASGIVDQPKTYQINCLLYTSPSPRDS